MRTKRGGQHGPRTHTTRPHRQGTATNMDTCLVLKRTHGSKDLTPHQSGTMYILALDPPPILLTVAVSGHARPNVPPNLALILAWTYGTVARALGSLVNLVPRLLLHSQTVPFTPTRERTTSRLATIHVLYNHKYHPIRGCT